MDIDVLIDKIRSQSTPFYKFLYNSYKAMHETSINAPPGFAKTLYTERILRHALLYWFSNKFYYEPMLRSKCTSAGKNLRTDGDIPLISGSGRIIIGDNVRIGNRGAWVLSPNLYDCPELIIGDNTSINPFVCISVECKVEIGKNCQIAGETNIFDNNSHSVYYRNNRKMTKDDVAPISIEDHVWVGMRSMIFKGVTIGMGSVVAAGSIVTKSIPSMTLVGGNPARVIKEIK